MKTSTHNGIRSTALKGSFALATLALIGFQSAVAQNLSDGDWISVHGIPGANGEVSAVVVDDAGNEPYEGFFAAIQKKFQNPMLLLPAISSLGSKRKFKSDESDHSSFRPFRGGAILGHPPRPQAPEQARSTPFSCNPAADFR